MVACTQPRWPYINHFGRKTANTHFGGHRTSGAAMIWDCVERMAGPAAMGILREMGMAHRKWHKSFPLTCPASR